MVVGGANPRKFLFDGRVKCAPTAPMAGTNPQTLANLVVGAIVVGNGKFLLSGAEGPPKLAWLGSLSHAALNGQINRPLRLAAGP